MERTWTTTGEQLGKVRPQLEAAIEKIVWRELIGDWPMAPGEAIKAVIRQVGIPNADQAGISESLISGRYALYGIQGTWRNGRGRVYVVDRGHDLVVVASDFWTNEPATIKEPV